MEIKSLDEFSNALNKHQRAYMQLAGIDAEYFSSFNTDQEKKFRYLEISGHTIWAITLEGLVFENCIFQNVSFYECKISRCDFINCVFINTNLSFSSFYGAYLKECVFKEGEFAQVLFSSVAFAQTTFDTLKEFTGITFGECGCDVITIKNTEINHLQIRNLYQGIIVKFRFESCHFTHSIFYSIDLIDTKFSECILSVSSFINCTLGINTFDDNCTTVENAFSSIDFQTILKSEIKNDIIETLFGVTNSSIKRSVMEMVSKVELHTVFISYSFKDKTLVRKIDDALRAKGVFTFLWEKDAPTGRRLKEIMSTNINKFDKLLFVASKNSLQSEACQYELSEARKKQDKNWSAVYFPIHIDDFLFQVQKHDIPRKNREEFWENIEELKEINSLNFTAFNSVEFNETEFENAINGLVKDLRKNN